MKLSSELYAGDVGVVGGWVGELGGAARVSSVCLLIYSYWRFSEK